VADTRGDDVALPWRATKHGRGLDFSAVLDRQVVRLISAKWLLQQPPNCGF